MYRVYSKSDRSNEPFRFVPWVIHYLMFALHSTSWHNVVYKRVPGCGIIQKTAHRTIL
jgi:hypothetical protein